MSEKNWDSHLRLALLSVSAFAQEDYTHTGVK
jgi:hypothetical protein